jgi:3-phenylpropionate/trans-cinnamate dioxygenase ferredoxin subunit
VVVCPRHGARFCLKTGSPLSPPAYEPIKIFSVREHDGRIELAL